MIDQYGRIIDYLRISVTDKCNFRCLYCMPEDGVESICHREILRFSEIIRICRCAAKLGIKKIKITGGEPLIRPGIVNLIRSIHEIEGIRQITLTTNGYLLEKYLPKLLEAGISGINISLDTLNQERFGQIARVEGLAKVYRALQKAEETGIVVKINCVPMEENKSDLLEIAALARKYNVHVRFIEMMPIGIGKSYHTIYEKEIRRLLEASYGQLSPYSEFLGNGPAHYYQLPGFQGKIGFISAMSHEFCEDCSRIRMTADGFFKLCLNYDSQINLKDYMRNGASDEELEQYMRDAIYHKPRRHGFLDGSLIQAETRKMAGIGG